MKRKFMFSSLLAAALVAGSAMTAFAAEPEDTDASYGYLAGQRQSGGRHAQFESAEGFATDAEREAFFETQGIGGGQYSGSQHLDAQDLADAGVISQAAADSIAAYASGKHDAIYSRYSGDMSGMTPDERHALYDGFEKDGFDGDSVDELFSKGIVTREQADAIKAYIG